MKPSDPRYESQNDVHVVAVEEVVKLGQIILQFSRIERATYHEDGLRRETDSDHTIMLGIVACALASELRPDLDVGLIAQYAFIHDLVEVYAGDTVTLGISETEKQEKNRREAEAFERIKNEFGSFPWLIMTIEDYEKLSTTEARFVKGVDKIMPTITHILNNGQLIKERGFTKVGMKNIFQRELSDMDRYSYDLPEIVDLKAKLSQIFTNIMYPEK